MSAPFGTGVVDYFGSAIYLGDVIAVVGRHSSSLHVRLRRVVGVKGGCLVTGPYYGEGKQGVLGSNPVIFKRGSR